MGIVSLELDLFQSEIEDGIFHPYLLMEIMQKVLFYFCTYESFPSTQHSAKFFHDTTFTSPTLSKIFSLCVNTLNSLWVWHACICHYWQQWVSISSHHSTFLCIHQFSLPIHLNHVSKLSNWSNWQDKSLYIKHTSITDNKQNSSNIPTLKAIFCEFLYFRLNFSLSTSICCK